MSVVKVDIHLHTRYSECSSMPVEFLIEQGHDPANRAICCTDHHNIMAAQRLRRELSDVLVVPAIEVETREGDVLVFSEDLRYLEGLLDWEGSVRELRRDDESCVVWAHPCVSQRISLVGDEFPPDGPFRTAFHEQVAAIMPHVDGLEIYNGTMLSLAVGGLLNPTYFRNLRYIADYFQVSATGGSDAHESELWGKVWTEFPAPLRRMSDFVKALRERRVRPAFDTEFFPVPPEFLT